jgi:hypothetical protein
MGTFVTTRMIIPVGLVIATAQVAFADPLEDAVRHYRAARAAYEAGECARAAEEYQAAYQIKPFSRILFDMARAFDCDEDIGSAVLTYKEFLKRSPCNASTNPDCIKMIDWAKSAISRLSKRHNAS